MAAPVDMPVTPPMMPVLLMAAIREVGVVEEAAEEVVVGMAEGDVMEEEEAAVVMVAEAVDMVVAAEGVVAVEDMAVAAIEMEAAEVVMEEAAVVAADMVAVETVMEVAAVDMEVVEAVVADMVVTVAAAVDMETVVAAVADMETVAAAVVEAVTAAVNKNAFNPQTLSLSRVSLKILLKMILHNFLALLELSRWTKEQTSQRSLSTPTDKLELPRVSAQLPMMMVMQLPVLFSGLMATI